MVMQPRRLGIAAVSAALAVTGAISVAQAADMPMAPQLEAMDDRPVEFATSWYIRGDLGFTRDTKLQMGQVFRPFSSDLSQSWTIGGGFGYKFNDWFRTDVTVDWRNPRTFNGNTAVGVPCQIGMNKTYVMTTTGGTDLYKNTNIYDSVGCADQTRSRITTLPIMFNAYIDMGTWYGITPYVGAGVGMTLLYQKLEQTWYRQSNGDPYSPVWTDALAGTVEARNWDRYTSQTTLNFTWNVMGGVSYALTDHTSVDVGYRYMHMGKAKSFDMARSKDLTAHEVRVGLRYMPD